jgi:hypothetical protein
MRACEQWELDLLDRAPAVQNFFDQCQQGQQDGQAWEEFDDAYSLGSEAYLAEEAKFLATLPADIAEIFEEHTVPELRKLMVWTNITCPDHAIKINMATALAKSGRKALPISEAGQAKTFGKINNMDLATIKLRLEAVHKKAGDKLNSKAKQAFKKKKSTKRGRPKLTEDEKAWNDIEETMKQLIAAGEQWKKEAENLKATLEALQTARRDDTSAQSAGGLSSAEKRQFGACQEFIKFLLGLPEVVP